MQEHKSNPSPDPTGITFPTLHQQAILREVSSLFHEADPSDYIEHINALLGLGLQRVGDTAYMGDVAYHVTKVVTLLARLGDHTRYQREQLIQGGMSDIEVYHNS